MFRVHAFVPGILVRYLTLSSKAGGGLRHTTPVTGKKAPARQVARGQGVDMEWLRPQRRPPPPYPRP